METRTRYKSIIRLISGSALLVFLSVLIPIVLSDWYRLPFICTVTPISEIFEYGTNLLKVVGTQILLTILLLVQWKKRKVPFTLIISYSLLMLPVHAFISDFHAGVRLCAGGEDINGCPYWMDLPCPVPNMRHYFWKNTHGRTDEGRYP